MSQCIFCARFSTQQPLIYLWVGEIGSKGDQIPGGNSTVAKHKAFDIRQADSNATYTNLKSMLKSKSTRSSPLVKTAHTSVLMTRQNGVVQVPLNGSELFRLSITAQLLCTRVSLGQMKPTEVRGGQNTCA